MNEWNFTACKGRILHLRFWKFFNTSRPNLISIYLLTYTMEHRPSWEASRFSASQKIPHILWNPKVHYCIHKCPPPDPIQSHLGPVHIPTPHFLMIHFNIIPPIYASVFQVVSFLQVSPPKPCIRVSSLPHVLHALPISFFSIMITRKYLVRSTDH